jgi:squalene-hopene/tetraprenyl-beta-curcumene cyclase
MTVRGVALVALLVVGLVGIDACQAQKKAKKPAPQYEFEKTTITAATAAEPTLPKFSLSKAVEYIEQGNQLWWKKRNCVACHTNGIYGVMRPALTPFLGKPKAGTRKFLVADLAKMVAQPVESLRTGIRPTQVAYLAGGLAEWDRHVTRKLSPETDQALRLLLKLQSDDGSFSNTQCWPPFESSAYQGTTVAAMAIMAAPGWLENLKDKDLQARVEKTRGYLRTAKPPHDYGKLLLLWTSTRMPGLIDAKLKQDLVASIWKHQQSDGGWSIRSFAQPEAWGNGNRAKKLRAEPEFKNPPSDGHQTGLAILVLRDAGVPAKDKRIAKGVKWLLNNQRQSGRWWTRSLNTDSYHFITYSGSCFPLIALSKCGVLPVKQAVTAAP